MAPGQMCSKWQLGTFLLLLPCLAQAALHEHSSGKAAKPLRARAAGFLQHQASDTLTKAGWSSGQAGPRAQMTPPPAARIEEHFHPLPEGRGSKYCQEKPPARLVVGTPFSDEGRALECFNSKRAAECLEQLRVLLKCAMLVI